MKILVATDATQGTRPGDFHYAENGEPVYFGVTCGEARDLTDDGSCGCGRAFTGLRSGKATTTAVVREVSDVTINWLARAVGTYLEGSGWADLYPSRQELVAEVRQDAAGLAAIALRFPTGTVVERRHAGAVKREVAHAGR